MPQTWDDVLLHYQSEVRAGRSGYTGITQSREQIRLNYLELYTDQHEWQVGDRIDTRSGTKHWRFGEIIKLSNSRDDVTIRFDDGATHAVAATGCIVKRKDHHDTAN